MTKAKLAKMIDVAARYRRACYLEKEAAVIDLGIWVGAGRASDPEGLAAKARYNKAEVELDKADNLHDALVAYRAKVVEVKATAAFGAKLAN